MNEMAGTRLDKTGQVDGAGMRITGDPVTPLT